MMGQRRWRSRVPGVGPGAVLPAVRLPRRSWPALPRPGCRPRGRGLDIGDRRGAAQAGNPGGLPLLWCCGGSACLERGRGGLPADTRAGRGATESVRPPPPPVPRSPERAPAAAARLPSAVRPRRALRHRGMLWDAVTWCLISSGRLPPPRSCWEAGTGSGSEADSFCSAPSSSPPPFFMSSCQLGRAVQFGSLGVGSELGGRWEVGGRGGGAPLEAKSWS